MKAIVGLKKYTSDPSCMSSMLFGHYYGILRDVEDGGGEIIKFDFDVLELSPQVNIYKEKHHKKKLKDDPLIIFMPSVKDDDAQRKTICMYNAMFVPFCLMQYVLDKDFNPCKAFLLLHDVIKAAKLTRSKGLLDFCCVVSTLAIGATLPSLTRSMAGNITAMSVSCPLIRFIKTKVLQRDLKGLIPDATTIDLVAQQLSNAITALMDAHIRTDEANEARREEKNEDKIIKSVYTGWRLVKLGNVCHVAPGAKLEDVLPQVYSLITNKPKQCTLLSTFRQDAEDIGLTMRIEVPILLLAVGT